MHNKIAIDRHEKEKSIVHYAGILLEGGKIDPELKDLEWTWMAEGARARVTETTTLNVIFSV
jgi:hypothetical protein